MRPKSFEGVWREWVRFDSETRATVELAVSRLAGSIQRTGGRFAVQDRILDVAIALEMMYELRRGGSFTLTTRAGHFLADSIDDRLAVAKRARALYRTRNAIVHGNVSHTRRHTREKQRSPRTEPTLRERRSGSCWTRVPFPNGRGSSCPEARTGRVAKFGWLYQSVGRQWAACIFVHDRAAE